MYIRKKTSIICFVFLFGFSSYSQQSNVKSWDIVKTFMGMDTATAQKIVKDSGYTYQRSFENIGLKFSEFSRGYTKLKM